MKKMNWKMIFGVGLISFLLLFCATFFYAYKKISPEEIKKIATAQLQKTFPNAKVEIGEIKLSPSFSFKLEVDNFKLAALKEGKEIKLFSAQELKIKIPLWAALTGSGKIEIKLDKPALNYAEFGISDEFANNWTYAMGVKAASAALTPAAIAPEAKVDTPTKEASSITIPAFLSDIKIDFRVYDIALDYSLKDNSKGQLTLSRFLIKDFHLKGQTAFELESAFSFNMKKEQTFSFSTLIVGQLNLGEFVEKQKLSTAIMIQLTNIKSSLLPKPLPDIKTDINVTILKEGKIEGNLTTVFNVRNKISTSFALENKKTRVSDLNVVLFIRDLAEMVDKKALLGDINDSALNFTGSLELASEEKNTPPHIIPDFKFSLSPDLEIPSMAGKAKVKLEGSYKGEAIQTSIVTQLLDGVAEVLFKGEFDPNTKGFDIKKLKPFTLNVKVSHLNITKDFIQKLLYSKKVEPLTEKTAESSESKDANEKEREAQVAASTPLVLPAGTISINWAKINLDKNSLDGKALILMSNDKVTTKSMTFSFSDGKGELSHLTQIEAKGMNHKFDFKLSGLNMAGLYPFLPPVFEQVKGTFSGAVKGSLDTPQKGALKYDVSVDVSAKNGELKGVNLSDYISAVLEKLPEALKSKLAGKKTNFDGNFETLLFKGIFKSEIYTFEKLKFIGVSNKIDVEGAGQMFPPPSDKVGIIDLNIIENTGMISSQLEKFAGTKVLPLRLTGAGFALKPDTQYTMDKLLKSTTKKQVEVIKSKAKDFLQEKLKEQMNGGASGGNVQDNIKGALKGLFKKK